MAISSSSWSSSSTNFIATQVLNKTSGPLCVTCYTTAVMSMLLWPIVCVAVWSAEQFRLQCSLECPQRRQQRDRRRQRIPNLCRGNGEGAIADGPVQWPWCKTLEPFRRMTRDSRVWQTDRRRDIIIANAALNYDERPKRLWQWQFYAKSSVANLAILSLDLKSFWGFLATKFVPTS